jgi:protein involved in sex pheromone biosynthesis
MKRYISLLALSSILLLSSCIPFVNRCDRDKDARRVQEVVQSMHDVAARVDVRYDEKHRVAVVVGYDRNKRLIRSEQVVQDCKL